MNKFHNFMQVLKCEDSITSVAEVQGKLLVGFFPEPA